MPQLGLNIFILFIPVAWVAHFANEKDKPPTKTFTFPATFILCFLSIIPLEKPFDYGTSLLSPLGTITLKQTLRTGGEQMAFYLGSDLGDLLVVTLNK